MAKILSDTPEFVAGFAEECFDKGFNEEQTAALLKTAARLELLQSGDPDFLDGMEKAAAPGGSLTKSLFRIPVNAHTMLGAGALGAGAAIPTFSRPTPFDTDESALSGAGKGALAGGVLAGLAGMGAAALTKGRGGRTNLRNFFSDINPWPTARNPHTGHIMPGYTTRLPQFDRPLGAIGKALSHPTTLKGVKYGVGYGGAAGLGVGLKDTLGGGGGFRGNYGPSAFGSSTGDSSGTTAGESGSGSIYSVPRTLRDYYAPSGSGAAAAGAVAGSGAIAGIQEVQNRMKSIDNRIAELQKTIGKMDRNNPNARLRAHDMQKEIKRLMREKDSDTGMLNRLVSRMSTEQARHQSAASHDYALATRRAEDARRSFDRHMTNLEGGTGESFLSSGWIAPLLAKLFNSEDRAAMQAADMTHYEDIRNKAQQAMQRSLF